MRYGLLALLSATGALGASTLDIQRQEAAAAALPYAELSEAVYGDSVPNGRWEIDNKYSDSDPNSGIHAVTYRDREGGGLVVAFAGTDFAHVGDRQADAENYFKKNGDAPKQYRQALEFVEKEKARCKCEVVVTGHSLGGGLASYVGGVMGLEAWAFNPAGLGKSTYKDVKHPSKITSLFVSNDPVHAIDKKKTKNPGKSVFFNFERKGNPVKKILDSHSMGLFREDLALAASGSSKPYKQPKKEEKSARAKKKSEPKKRVPAEEGKVANSDWRDVCTRGGKCYSRGPAE